MTIDALPTVPSTASPTTFATDMDTFLAALPTFRTQANALAAGMGAISAGTAIGIPYTFSTTTADADPGAGTLRLDNATQNLATTIRADLAGSDGSDFTDVLATFDDSTSTVKGYIGLQKLADPTKWILFSVSALASPAGYRNITVAVVAASAASPFAAGDDLVLKFTRNGDKGDTGGGGFTTIASGSLPAAATLDITNIPATYACLVLQVTGMSSGGTGIVPRVQVSTNNGATFDTTATNYLSFYVNNATVAATGAATLVQRSSMTAAETTDLTVVISGYQSGPHTKFQGRAGDGTNVNEVVGTYVGSTSAIDALRIGWSGAGNFDAGTYALYGVS